MLIISVQNFGNKTQKIINQINQIKGVFAIRTDRPISTKHKVIGLKKNKRKYYITTKKEDIKEVSEWSDYVAIDCRVKNNKLKDLLEYCLIKKIYIVADISCKDDIDYLIKYKKIVKYVATTFNFNKDIKQKCKIIKIAKSKGFKVIAEGGYYDSNDIKKSILAGSSHVCIGSAIFDYIGIIKKYSSCCKL